jgi:Mrp family chromosome partitioning ATPase
MSENNEQMKSEETAMPNGFYPDLSASETQKMQSFQSIELQGIVETPLPPPQSSDVQEKAPVDETQQLQRHKSIELQSTIKTPLPPPQSPAVQEKAPADETQQLQIHKSIELQSTTKTPLPPPQSPAVQKKAPGDKALTTKITKRDTAAIQMIQERCRQLCFSLFFREHAPVRSVGFTSSINGEGKSFLSLVTAQVLAHDANEPVTLVECNWEHPSLHEYFGVPATPGLAELLRGSCNEDDIRYQVEDNLTIIPAGNGSQDSMKLLNLIQRVGFHNYFANKSSLFVVELPPILTAGYGPLAARLVESVIIVVHAKITSDNMLTETFSLIKDLPIDGIIQNQRESHIPHWIRQIL